MIRINLKAYHEYLFNNKFRVIRGKGNYLWIEHEKFAVIRFPEWNVEIASDKELSCIFKRNKCLVINFTILPAENESANAYLYNCCNQNYSIDNLSSSSVRRNIRLAQRNLRCGFSTKNEILKFGLKAYTETRTRVGLSDGTKKSFRKRFAIFFKNPAHKAVAAWYNDELVAFLSLIVVDDFVIIQGTFSTDKHKNLKPNNMLVDFVLNHFLTKEKYRLVCYGLSSIQEDSEKEGLHKFKIQVGFSAIPVKRMITLHPKIKRFEKVISYFLHILLKFFPKNRIIRKASGVFRL